MILFFLQKQEANGSVGALQVDERVPDEAAGRPEGGHEHHDVHQV